MTHPHDALVGKKVPHVQLDSSQGKKMNLPQDLLGKWTVLYFYPKDDTPGCTKQACSYRDGIRDFTAIGAQVLGVSTDDLVSHDSFIQKFSLNFPLLADTERKLSEALGVLSRDTFLIDPEGTIQEVWRKVSATTTMSETLEAIKQRL